MSASPPPVKRYATSYEDESSISEEGSYNAVTIGNLREKLVNAFAPTRRKSSSSTPRVAKERSQSRGRDALTSTGRGGAGNFKRSESVSRDRVSRAVDGDERGRELSPQHPDRVTHSGRGGAGNIRSPSRDPAAIAQELKHEQEVIDAAKVRDGPPILSTGRGGLGNIRNSPGVSPSPVRNGSRSRSRDPAAGQRYQSSGRGGRGNIHHENAATSSELEKLEEDERRFAGHEAPLHSTGRGGAANVTSLAEPAESHSTSEAADAHPDGVHHTGKGGYGNIVAGGQSDRGRSDAKHAHGGLGGLWNKVTGHGGNTGAGGA